MKEQWHKWKPVNDLSRKYYLERIIDTPDEFKVMLSDLLNPNKQAHILFKESVHCYRKTYESFASVIIHDLHEKYGEEFYGDWTFFKVTNSEYLEWISQKSAGWSDYREPLIHFSLLLTDYIIDIVDTTEPNVQLIEVV